MSEILKKANQDLKAFMQNHFPDHIEFDDDTYTIQKGSTQVMVKTSLITENQAVIDCVSQVVTDANLNDGLKGYLLRQNSELKFGGFGLLFDGTIIYSQSVLAKGDFTEHLKSSLSAVASVSDYYDDIIVEKAGGKRAVDKVDLED